MKQALINGILLNGRKDMFPLSNHILYIEDGKIMKITSDPHLLDGYEVIDLQGQYVLPGLINLHVHFPSSGKPSKKQSDPVKLVKFITSTRWLRKIAYKICEKAATTQLNSGVTTLRTMGGILNIDSMIRDNIEKGTTVGPRILASNMAISVAGGHMADSLAYTATSSQHGRELVRKIARSHADVIKLMITGGVLDAKKLGEPGELKMPAEYVKAACDEAHRLGLKVAAHVESPHGVLIALANGVDTIEHGAEPTPEILDLFKKRKAAHVATLSPALPFALFDRSVSHAEEMAQENGKIVFNGIIDCAKACLANDIPVGLGTDTGCPFITHYDMWREVVYFQKYCHVSNAFALYSATLGNAKIAGVERITGSIQAGKSADLIFMKDNPLKDLKALRHLTGVMIKGQLIQPKIKKMKNVETELDKFL